MLTAWQQEPDYPVPVDFASLGPDWLAPWRGLLSGWDLGSPWLLTWCALIGLGLLAGGMAIFARRLVWPPRLLRLSLALGTAALTLETWSKGMPPAFEVSSDAELFRSSVVLAQERYSDLARWLAAIGTVAFPLGLCGLLERSWRRFAAALGLALPYLVLVLYGLSDLQEIGTSMNPTPEIEGAFLRDFPRNQYFWTCASLAAALFLFLVLELLERRYRRTRRPEPAPGTEGP